MFSRLRILPSVTPLREVQEWTERSAELTQEVAAQDAVAQDLAARADTLTATVADEIAAAEARAEGGL